jgi:Zn-dependent protease
MPAQSPDPLYVIVSIVIVLASLTVHEAAHAWTSNHLGDPTAKQLGRVSLNPLVHLDLIGSVVLPLVAAASNMPILGWAKPVPVDMRRLRNPRRDFMIVAAAGPISNILLAVIGAVVIAVTATPLTYESPLHGWVEINILLAVFNLLPVPPLDGGNVLMGLLPPNTARAVDSIRPFGIIILYGLMLSGVLTRIIMPPARFLWELLIL